MSKEIEDIGKDRASLYWFDFPVRDLIDVKNKEHFDIAHKFYHLAFIDGFNDALKFQKCVNNHEIGS